MWRRVSRNVGYPFRGVYSEDSNMLSGNQHQGARVKKLGTRVYHDRYMILTKSVLDPKHLIP